MRVRTHAPGRPRSPQRVYAHPEFFSASTGMYASCDDGGAIMPQQQQWFAERGHQHKQHMPWQTSSETQVKSIEAAPTIALYVRFSPLETAGGEVKAPFCRADGAQEPPAKLSARQSVRSKCTSCTMGEGGAPPKTKQTPSSQIGAKAKHHLTGAGRDESAAAHPAPGKSRAGRDLRRGMRESAARGFVDSPVC